MLNFEGKGNSAKLHGFKNILNSVGLDILRSYESTIEEMFPKFLSRKLYSTKKPIDKMARDRVLEMKMEDVQSYASFGRNDFKAKNKDSKSASNFKGLNSFSQKFQISEKNFTFKDMIENQASKLFSGDNYDSKVLVLFVKSLEHISSYKLKVFLLF